MSFLQFCMEINSLHLILYIYSNTCTANRHIQKSFKIAVIIASIKQRYTNIWLVLHLAEAFSLMISICCIFQEIMISIRKIRSWLQLTIDYGNTNVVGEKKLLLNLHIMYVWMYVYTCMHVWIIDNDHPLHLQKLILKMSNPAWLNSLLLPNTMQWISG